MEHVRIVVADDHMLIRAKADTTRDLSALAGVPSRVSNVLVHQRFEGALAPRPRPIVSAMSPAVSVVDLEPRPTAVIPATTTWAEFCGLWGTFLGEVWTFLRANDHLLHAGGSSVILYKDDTPTVEVGALVSGVFAPSGRIVLSQLPSGQAARAVHCGPYSDLGVTHDAVVAWCVANGRTRTGQRWEIYGDHHDDPSELTTEVYWQLAD